MPGDGGRRALGIAGEEAAARWVERRGGRILARNARTPHGELDVVWTDGETLVFTEVRTRATDAFGDPGETVGPAKRLRLRRAALWWMSRSPEHRDAPARFDVASILWRPGAAHPEVEVIEHAFE